MKKLFYLLIFAPIYMNIIGCSNKQQNCNIDILLCESPVDGKLTDESREFLLPFERGDKILCTPQGNIFNTVGKVSYVKEKNWFDKVRGNITKNTSIAILHEKINNHLKDLDIANLSVKSPIRIDSIKRIIAFYDVVLGYSTSKSINESLYTFKIYGNSKDISSYIKDSILTKNPESKILIVYNPPIVNNPPIVSNEKQNLVTETTNCIPDKDVQEIKAELMKLADIKNSKRIEMIDGVFEKYFTKNAYVDLYSDVNDKNPRNWGQGEAKKYLGRLASLPSIIDLCILKIERDVTSQKVSGMRIIEVHNGSVINQ